MPVLNPENALLWSSPPCRNWNIRPAVSATTCNSGNGGHSPLEAEKILELPVARGAATSVIDCCCVTPEENPVMPRKPSNTRMEQS